MRLIELHLIKSTKLPSTYDKHDYGRKAKPKLLTVVLRDTKTGKVYGTKSIYQKDIN